MYPVNRKKGCRIVRVYDYCNVFYAGNAEWTTDIDGAGVYGGIWSCGRNC